MYELTIVLKDVTEGDVTDLAQRIWEEEATDFDAKLGDFEISITKIEGDFHTSVDWIPEG